ncbi:MAG TPA: hypothetical protein VJX94_13790 [Stellaceae bacterium]|nr:hypothetical protein [Stellaceae bacterium]
MTKSVIDLAAAHLRRQFLYQTQRGRFGSMESLLELAISARGCVASSLFSGRVTVAFVLERVLNQCAADLAGPTVRISEIADLSDRLHDPVLRAVDFLAGADDDPVDIAVFLIRARQLRER